jgi:sugar O-acyltransferase (sialic acid O-acetyltransferase NeuD family)
MTLEIEQRTGYSSFATLQRVVRHGQQSPFGEKEMAVRSRKDVVLVGARGLAKDIIGYLEEDGGFRIVCLLDQIAATQLLGYDVVRPEEFDGGCRDALLAVGLPAGKIKVLALYARFAFRWSTFIDRRCAVSPRATLGEGCILAPYAILAGDVRLGSHVYVGSFAGAGHDSVIGSVSSLLPHSGVLGGATLGARSLLGAAAHVLPGICVGDDVEIAAGAVVRKDVPNNTRAVGNPARMMAKP